MPEPIILSAIPDSPSPLEPNAPENKADNMWRKILIILSGCTLFAVIILIFIVLSVQKSTENIKNIASNDIIPTPTIILLSIYANPFDTKASYENPFAQNDTYQNPFDTSQ